MALATKPIPEGFQTITPSLTVRGADKAIDFYKRAFGAEERMRMPGPGGVIMHAELRIGSSIFMLNDEMPQMDCPSPQALGGTPFGLYVYVEDADAIFSRAVAAGATIVMPIADMFWGDRCGAIKDPYGHRWSIATRKEDLTKDEIEARQRAAFSQMQQQQQQQ